MRSACSAIQPPSVVLSSCSVVSSSVSTFLSLDGFLAQLLVKFHAEPRRTHHRAHELVVRHAAEEVVAACRDVVPDLPLLLLQLDVRLLLLRLKPLEELREPVPVRV